VLFSGTAAIIRALAVPPGADAYIHHSMRRVAMNTKAQTTPYTVSPAVTEVYTRLEALPAVRKGLDFLKADHANTVQEQKQICEIPAPPFAEQIRAADFQKRLAALRAMSSACGRARGTVRNCWWPRISIRFLRPARM
jgi:hypothetical protein